MGIGFLSKQDPPDLSSPVAELVRECIFNNEVVIFSKTYCPYCKMAKEVFDKLGCHYEVIELDKREDGDQIQSILELMTGTRTVPRVFVDGKFIGGGNDVKRLYEDGSLQVMIRNRRENARTQTYSQVPKRKSRRGRGDSSSGKTGGDGRRFWKAARNISAIKGFRTNTETEPLRRACTVRKRRGEKTGAGDTFKPDRWTEEAVHFVRTAAEERLDEKELLEIEENNTGVRSLENEAHAYGVRENEVGERDRGRRRGENRKGCTGEADEVLLHKAPRRN